MSEDNPDDRPRPWRDRRDDRSDDRDDDYDDRPRQRRRSDDPEDDDYDDRPRRRRRPAPDPMDDPAMGLLIPINTSALAIAAGYMGLFAVLCLPAPIALLLGILALANLKKNPKLRGKGRAIFAIVMGVIFTLLPLVLIVVSQFVN